MTPTENLRDFLIEDSFPAGTEEPMSDEEIAAILDRHNEPEPIFIPYNDDEEYDSLIDDTRPDKFQELDFND